MSEEEVKFCPMLTVIRPGQTRESYTACQFNCVFYLDGECAFITTAKLLKEAVKPKIIDIVSKAVLEGMPKSAKDLMEENPEKK